MHSVNLDKILKGVKTLTPPEHEVLNEVVSGRLNKEIASELGITIRTVKEHCRRVMEKMNAKSLAELVTMVVRDQDDDSSETDRGKDKSHRNTNFASPKVSSCITPFMSPVHFTPEKQCYSVLFL